MKSGNCSSLFVATPRIRTMAAVIAQEDDELMEAIKSVRGLRRKMMKNCHCETLEQCG
jgi:hypothetical protein